MQKKKKIYPSLLAADAMALGTEIDHVMSAGADGIHLDIMDNHYVPNLTFGPHICGDIRKHSPDTFIDVHLMTKPVDDLIMAFAKQGANAISFHPEASTHVDRSLRLIRSNGIQAGLALNPASPLNLLEHVYELLDFVLIMSVNPGFGGQQFIPESLEKIQSLYEIKEKHYPKLSIAVDGGINLETLSSVCSAGADTFIAGSAIYQKQTPYQNVIDKMRKLIDE